MARINTIPDVILRRTVARLIDQIENATSSTCFISDDPDAINAGIPGDIWYTVTPGVSGTFPEPYFDGGGQNQALVETLLAVTIHNIQLHDEVGRGTEFYGNDDRGMFDLAKPVLKAIAQHDLQDESGNEILNQPFFPRDYNITRDTEKRIGRIQLAFSVSYDWDLS